MNDALVYTEAAALGALTGIRSTAGPAAVGELSNAGLIAGEGSPLAWFNHEGVGKVLRLLVAGESIADKLPFIPARTEAGPLAARAIGGGLSGAAVCAAAKRPWWIGALIGAGAAVGASFAATKLREYATKQHDVPDRVIGVIEDAVVAGAGYLVVSSIKSRNGALARS